MPVESFERRTFIKMLGAGLGAAAVSLPGLTQAITSARNSDKTRFSLGKPEWILHEDGTFDIYAGSIRLINCRPSINGQSIFIRNTFMGDSPKGKRIIYEVEDGFVMVDLRTHSNTISIGAEISGMKTAPLWFSPLGEGYVVEADHFFKQGFGTGGQSGIFGFRKAAGMKEMDFPDEDAWQYDSFLATGLIAPNGDTLAIGAYEHSDFVQRSSVFNRPNRKGIRSKFPGKQTVFFESGFVTEGITLKDEFLKLPDLFIYCGNQPFGTMQNLAWSISEQNQARRDTDTNYYWSSFQDFRTAFSFKYLTGQLQVLDEIQPAIPLQTVLIGPGYCIPGDWLSTGDNWPKTMDDAARQIFQRKYRAGIYVAPFVAHEKSKVFRNHPHWILKDWNDDPVVLDEDADGRLYALDASSEDVKDYISKIFRNFRKMGYTYYELDYLDFGLKDVQDFKHVKKGKTSVQYFREVMDIIRDEVGAGSFITANKAPYAPLIGYVDAMRIDGDQSWKWDRQTLHIFSESYNTQYFNNVFWQNDPDVVFLRNYKSDFSNEEQKSLAFWVGMTGGAIGISDNFKLLDSNKLQLWRFLEPVKRPRAATLPFWGYNVGNKVVVRNYPELNAWGVLVLNDGDEAVSETYQVQDITGQRDGWVYFWDAGFSMGLGSLSKIVVSLNPHDSKLFYISSSRENPALNLSLAGKEFTID